MKDIFHEKLKKLLEGHDITCDRCNRAMPEAENIAGYLIHICSECTLQEYLDYKAGKFNDNPFLLKNLDHVFAKYKEQCNDTYKAKTGKDLP